MEETRVVGRVMNPEKGRIQPVIGYEVEGLKGCFEFFVIGTKEHFRKRLDHVTDEVKPIPENIYSTLERTRENIALYEGDEVQDILTRLYTNLGEQLTEQPASEVSDELVSHSIKNLEVLYELLAADKSLPPTLRFTGMNVSRLAGETLKVILKERQND